jgi:succinate dehydrogenase/fumarate reductase flavoprotein subunit
MSTEQPVNTLSCNRRTLLKVAGIGAAAMALPLGMLANSNVAHAADIQQSSSTADVVIIGGGIAGALAAYKASEAGAKVTLIDKGTVGRSGLSPFFGAYNYYDPKTSGERDYWIKEKQEGGAYLTQVSYVNQFLDDSLEIYNEMLDKGANISTKGHVHAWRDVLIKNGVTLIERTMATELIKEKGRIVGVAGVSLDDEKLVVVGTKAVVLASGSGALKTPGFPCNSITHDGDMMAYRIGAEITGKEFIDFHWTHWKDPAAMYDNWKSVLGGNMMAGSDCSAGGGALDMALAVNAGNIPLKMDSMGPSGGDAPGGDSGDKAGPPPGGDSGGHSGPGDGGGFTPPGIRDVSLAIAGGATAGMSAHKTEGIFPQNEKCESNIPGLYAAGDALATSGAAYHGVGTSSSMSAVQGANAGKYAAAYAKTVADYKIPAAKKNDIATRMFSARTAEKGFNPEWVTQVLQGTMVPYYVLYIKSEERLNAALANIQYMRSKFENYLIASNMHELRQALELKNMMLNSEMKLRAALMRKESRGSHYREDYPEQDDKNWLKWVIISQNGDKIKLSTKDVPNEWKPKS